jgi:hypothetical protein
MMRSKVFVVLASMTALCLGGGSLYVALGSGEEKTPAAPPSAVQKAAPAPAASDLEKRASRVVEIKEGDTLSGVVTVKTDIPKRKKIKMDADPKCAAMHAEPPLTEDIVTDSAGHVEWAFVYVKKGAEGKTGPEPPPAEINQTGCHYVPHVLGIMVGKELTVRNSDELLHNIHALPFSNKEFNFGQPQKGMTEKKTFSTPEIMVKVKCDVHPWMGAWIGVLDHPFYAVTNAAGKYEIKGLPAGKYTVEAWHEKYKNVDKDVEVKGPTTLDFDFTEKKE